MKLCLVAVTCAACGSNHAVTPDAKPDARRMVDAMVSDARAIDALHDASPPPPRICGDGTRDQGEVCFAAIAPIDVGVTVQSARLVDVDRDGHLDLVYLTTAGIEIRLGNGLGAFGAAIAGPATSARYLQPGDFDADGHVDVVTAGANDMSVWRNDGTTFTAFASTQIPRPATGLATGDFDSYAGDEVVLADATFAQWWRVAGANDLRPQSLVSTSNTQHLIGGLLDDDAIADVLLGTTGNADAAFGGNGGFASVTSYSNQDVITGVAIGDVDADGHADAILATATPSIAAYHYDEYNRFEMLDPGCAPGTIAAADLDQHTGAEVVIACPADHHVRVAAANAIVRDVDVGATISDLSVGGDVNGDGIADPVVTLQTSIVVLLSAAP